MIPLPANQVTLWHCDSGNHNTELLATKTSRDHVGHTPIIKQSLWHRKELKPHLHTDQHRAYPQSSSQKENSKDVDTAITYPHSLGWMQHKALGSLAALPKAVDSQQKLPQPRQADFSACPSTLAYVL